MTVRLQVVGKVQGVYYRASTQKFAQSLSLVGWVQNELDGSVTIVAQGSDNNIQELTDWCKHGVTLARVDSVTLTPVESIRLRSFEIRK